MASPKAPTEPSTRKPSRGERERERGLTEREVCFKLLKGIAEGTYNTKHADSARRPHREAAAGGCNVKSEGRGRKRDPKPARCAAGGMMARSWRWLG